MSSRIAVLARRDHPEGWGYPNFKKCSLGEHHVTPGGRAHGYVVLLVECEDDKETEALVEHCMRSEPVTGIFGSEGWDTWYGGVFDLVAWIAPHVTLDMIGIPAAGHAPRSQSIGDNRYVGVVRFCDIPSWKDGLAHD